MSRLPRSPAQWQIPKRYEVQTVLGSGAFGTVCQAYDHHSKCLVAIKRVDRLFDNVVSAKKTLRELKILTALEHENIIRLYGAFIPKHMSCFNELYMVMEICDEDLRKLIQVDCTLERAHIKFLTYNLLLGLKYLHSAGIYHRDLKPENILVNQDCTVKICDFNLACAAPEVDLLISTGVEVGGPEPSNRPVVPGTMRAQRQLTQLVVTRWYRAPEVILLQRQYTEAIDIWSVGCIFAEMLEMLSGGPSHEDRGALFPGSTAYPADTRNTRRGHDQLHLIIDMLGTPTVEEIQRLEAEGARTYVQSLPVRVGTGLSSRFPWVEEEDLDLLQKMLCFDSTSRITVDHAIDHNFFHDVRNPTKEIEAPARIKLDFENDCDDLDQMRLRRHFREHVSTMQEVARERKPEARMAGA